MKVLTLQLDGKRKSGRPKLQWIDSVNSDSKLFGLSNWKAIMPDRDCWRRLVGGGQD